MSKGGTFFTKVICTCMKEVKAFHGWGLRSHFYECIQNSKDKQKKKLTQHFQYVEQTSGSDMPFFNENDKKNIFSVCI